MFGTILKVLLTRDWLCVWYHSFYYNGLEWLCLGLFLSFYQLTCLQDAVNEVVTGNGSIVVRVHLAEEVSHPGLLVVHELHKLWKEMVEINMMDWHRKQNRKICLRIVWMMEIMYSSLCLMKLVILSPLPSSSIPPRRSSWVSPAHADSWAYRGGGACVPRPWSQRAATSPTVLLPAGSWSGAPRAHWLCCEEKRQHLSLLACLWRVPF